VVTAYTHVHIWAAGAERSKQGAFLKLYSCNEITGERFQ